ncbi:GNAT family N-acetyltransferase [bacterium]|nr:GNAT family N-acetyltransferase [bacterium]
MQQGLPERLRAEAAELYWEAFGSKLGRVLGPKPKAMAYLYRVIRADHVLVALSRDGHLMGLAGFKTPQASFVAGGLTDLRAGYGLIGGTWRARLLSWLSTEVDNENFLLDGLCVAADWRGQGLGTALLGAICAEAQSRGYGSVRLDVVDSNWRAHALYRRLGFVETRRQSIGLLRHVFRFDSAITMVHRI